MKKALILFVLAFFYIASVNSADFEFTVKSDNAGTSNDDQFTLPLPGAGVYDCLIDWGDGSAPEVKNTNTSITHTFLGGAGTYSISISGIFPRIVFNNGGDKLKLLSVEQFGEVGWTSLNAAFFGCGNLTSFIAGITDTSVVTSLYRMFEECRLLATIDLSSFDTSSVTRMDNMFINCRLLTTIDFSSFDTSSVIAMNHMFYGCSGLTVLDLSSFNTSLVASMQRMFYGCLSLATVDISTFDTSSVASMAEMFRNCSLLDVDVSHFDIALMTNAHNMFNGTGFSQTNYDLLLVAWEAQVEQPNVTFHAGIAQYSAGAPTTAKAALAGNGWNITDGGQSTIPGWSDEASATILSDTSPHSGTKCMKVTAGAANVGARQNANLVSGRSYTVAVYAKVTAGDTASLVVDTGDGTVITLDSTTSTTWVMLQGTFIATGTNGVIYLHAVVNGDIVWFDHCSMFLNDPMDGKGPGFWPLDPNPLSIPR